MIHDQFVLYIISAILAFVTLVVGLVLTNSTFSSFITTTD